MAYSYWRGFRLLLCRVHEHSHHDGTDLGIAANFGRVSLDFDSEWQLSPEVAVRGPYVF